MTGNIHYKMGVYKNLGCLCVIIAMSVDNAIMSWPLYSMKECTYSSWYHTSHPPQTVGIHIGVGRGAEGAEALQIFFKGGRVPPIFDANVYTCYMYISCTKHLLNLTIFLGKIASRFPWNHTSSSFPCNVSPSPKLWSICTPLSYIQCMTYD